ncbi:uncharacterized protein E0L32_004144 [Thyridium curvatum]|uniref:Uncharacterized protein n=1 Tax=Thyridium curvatum TaxID=1093900 RepID=A0A507BFS0_9PEZI|nr:uncharacterized protein E0L32_004144 [Thyridium curvatum]TPX16149.1 hypothetical protein E0L32_004144 [Thyridium curvatum]
MANLQYFTYPGHGVKVGDFFGYSQAVRVGDRLECSGQGGWDTTTGEVPADLMEEIDQAFANVDYNLRHAGGKGWSQVFRVNIYYTDGSPEALGRMAENMKKWMPNHRPILTGVGVKELALEGMRVEIEVSAYLA